MHDATSSFFAAAALSCAFLVRAGLAVAGTDPCPDVCPANLDGDEAVGMNDLLSLLRAWGECPPAGECRADLNDDGVVDAADVFALLADWGPCPAHALFAGALMDLDGHIAAVDDFNRDGAPDVVLLDSRYVTIAGNDGEGRLSVMATLAEDDLPTEVLTGDFDGDGNADVVITAQHRNTISVLLGDGTGAFAPQPPILAVPGPRAVTAVDIDGDGLPDLVATSLDDTLRSLRNVGKGRFGAPVPIDVGATVYVVTVDDFNGDGRADLLAATAEGDLRLLINDGKGSFEATPEIPVEGSLEAVALLDFNDDGNTDLAIATTGVTVTLLRNDGSGAFVESNAFFVDMESLNELAAGDFNEDGHPDLAVFGELRTAVFPGDGDGGFGPETTVVPAGEGTATILDLNGDGHLDLLAEEGPLWVLLGDGTGGFGVGWVPTTGGPLEVLLRDVNGDGHLDIVSLTRGSGISVRPGDGRGSFGAGGDFAVSAYSRQMTIADIDGDGDLDLAVTDQVMDTVWLLRNDGAGNFGEPDGALETDDPGPLVLADLDGDDLPELIVATRERIEIWPNLGGTFGSPSVLHGVPDYLQTIVAHDFDGDSDRDLAFGHGDVTVFHNNGSGGFGEPHVFEHGDWLVPADMDADGDIDLVTVRAHRVWLLRNDGNANFSSTVLLDVFPGSLQHLAVDDLNGDGHPDVVVPSQQQTLILLNDGTGLVGSSLTLRGNRRFYPADIGDVDGDGDADIAAPTCTGLSESDLNVCSEGGIAVLFNQSLPCPDGD